MADNKDQIIESLQKELVDLKIRIKRIEEYILDNFNFSDPGDYIQKENDYEYDQAVKLVIQFNTASASFLQRKLSIGYARAARLLDLLEENGIVGPATGAEPRKVLKTARIGSEEQKTE